MSIIEQVKTLLGISDDLQDNLLSVIQMITESHFKAYSKQDNIPEILNYIIVEVMVKRFNRIGSEGMSSQSVEVIILSFELDYFADYVKVIHRQFACDFLAGFKAL